MTEMLLRRHPGDTTVDGALTRLSTDGRIVMTEATGIGRLKALSSGDTLFILGHGQPNDLGGDTPSEPAALLSGNGLPSGVDIQLVACNSGSGRAPYSLERKVALVSKKIVPASIQGGTNYMRVKADGTLGIADCNWATQTRSGEIQDGSETEMTPWGPRTKRTRRQA